MGNVSWEESRAASAELLATAKEFDAVMEETFASENGIYAFIYEGKQLGGPIFGDPVARIVYIGHASTDSLRHWQDDTGVSTVRRSLAALLAGDLDLRAIPRSNNLADEDRFANYKLDPESEAKLTAWMKQNLRVAFLPLEKGQTDAWYTALINYNTPMFVFTNNPDNAYGAQIKQYRNILAEKAARA